MEGGRDSQAQRVLRVYQRSAPTYDRSMRPFERLLFADARRWVCARARGHVLEIGVGTGLNLALYAPDVRLTGIDVSEHMLAIARGRAARLGREVELRAGDAQALAFPDESFDCVVGTLTLCTVPDERRALAEARRVLRPQGRLLLLEHVRSPNRLVRSMQRLLDPLAVRFQADHLLRDPADHLSALGFEVLELVRERLGLVERVHARRA